MSLKIKKKVSGWKSSKLENVSHVLVELRRKGKSLNFMREFLINYHAIEVNKSTIHRYFKKISLK